MFLESQGGLQGQGSQKGTLWDGHLGAGRQGGRQGQEPGSKSQRTSHGVAVEAVSAVGESRETEAERRVLRRCVCVCTRMRAHVPQVQRRSREGPRLPVSGSGPTSITPSPSSRLPSEGLPLCCRPAKVHTSPATPRWGLSPLPTSRAWAWAWSCHSDWGD